MEKLDYNDIPYKDLEKVGLTSEMINDLPKKVTQDLLLGKPSPIVPIIIKTSNLERLLTLSRFSFKKDIKGKVIVLFYPKLKNPNSSFLGSKDSDDLMLNSARAIRIIDKENKERYISQDKKTKTLISLPVEVIKDNLKIIEDAFNLTKEEKTSLEKGNPITLMDKNDAYTIGIDLNKDDAIRIVKGNEQDWYNALNPKEDFKKYNFGINGCWVYNEKEELSYIKEEDYTDEIWQEASKEQLLKLNY